MDTPIWLGDDFEDEDEDDGDFHKAQKEKHPEPY